MNAIQVFGQGQGRKKNIDAIKEMSLTSRYRHYATLINDRIGAIWSRNQLRDLTMFLTIF